MIVLPARSITTAPRGTLISLTRATAVRRPSLMSSRASVTGGPPEPSMSVAPCSAIMPLPDGVQPATATAHTAHTAIRRYGHTALRRLTVWDPMTCGRGGSASGRRGSNPPPSGAASPRLRPRGRRVELWAPRTRPDRSPLRTTHRARRASAVRESPQRTVQHGCRNPERAAGAPARDDRGHPANAPACRRRGVLAAPAARRLLPTLGALRLFLGFRARGLPLLLGLLLRLLAGCGLRLRGGHRLAHRPHRGRCGRRRRHRREHGLRHPRTGPAAFRHLHML